MTEHPTHPPSSPPDPPSEDELSRVADVMERVRAGARQRRAERATVGGDGEGARHRLLELKGREYVQEPIPVSPRPVIGRALVFFRKAAYHLLFKWHARGVVEQQNLFNQSASSLLQELLEGQEQAGERVRRLERRILELEARLATREGGADETAPPSEPPS